MPAPTGAGPAMPAAPTAQASLTGARRTPLKRVSRSFFALVLLALVANIGFLWAIAQAFNADRQARQRHEVTLAFVDDLRHESDRLGRLVRAYVSTANARYLRVYYDILAVRTGEKAAPLADPPVRIIDREVEDHDGRLAALESVGGSWLDGSI